MKDWLNCNGTVISNNLIYRQLRDDIIYERFSINSVEKNELIRKYLLLN